MDAESAQGHFSAQGWLAGGQHLHVPRNMLEVASVLVSARVGLPCAHARREKAAPKAGWQVLSTCLGSELVGLQYEPLFPYFKDHPSE